MSEQQYRVVADRDKGDDPQVSDLNAGDRATVIVMNEDPACDRVVRIERPVPTEHCLSTAHHAGHEWGAHDEQPGSGYWCDGFDASDEQPSVPTREQIAEAIWRAYNYLPGDLVTGAPWKKSDYMNRAAAALALFQNGADR